MTKNRPVTIQRVKIYAAMDAGIRQNNAMTVIQATETDVVTRAEWNLDTHVLRQATARQFVATVLSEGTAQIWRGLTSRAMTVIREISMDAAPVAQLNKASHAPALRAYAHAAATALLIRTPVSNVMMETQESWMDVPLYVRCNAGINVQERRAAAGARAGMA
jgi:hypothetical protein